MLNGTTLIVTSIERPPYAYIKRDSEGKVTGGSGLVFDIIDIVADRLNFSYVVQTPDENQIGTRTSNGSWTGIIGQLKSQKADFAAAILTVSNERMEAVDFSTPLWQGTFSLLMRSPRGKIDSSALLYPFSVTTWLCFLLAVAIAGPTMSLVKRAEDWLLSADGSKLNPDRDGITRWSWMAYAQLLTQDSPQVKTFAIRVVVLTWAIFGLVLSAFYTANLTAYVTVPMYGFPVERLEDLRTNTEVKWLARSGTFLTATIEDHNATDDSSYTQLFAKMRNDKSSRKGVFTNSDDEAVNLVLKQDMTVYAREAVVLEQIVADDIRTNRECRFVIGPESNMKTNEAIAFSKGSQYKKPFDDYIEVLKKRGLVDALVRSHVTNKVFSCPLVSRGKVMLRPMGASSLLTPCAILMFGFVCAILSFAFEKCYSRKKKKIRKVGP